MPSARTYRRRVISWYADHGRDFPWRKTTDPYAVLVAELLLQRTSGSHVTAVYEEFMQRWPTPERLAHAKVSSLAALIRPLGLSKRAMTLKTLGAELVELHHVPLDPAALETLHGVGPYAAHMTVVLTTNRPLPVIDWVIARVVRRYFGLSGDRRPNADKELWALATKLSRPDRARELWLGTLDLAAAVCRRRPLCNECPLQTSCSHAVGASA